MLLGDLQVIGTPPAKLTKALAVIAAELHPAFNRVPKLVKDRSRTSCVLTSHAVRDFLWRIGFEQARLQTCYTILRGLDAEGVELHSLGVGDHRGMPTLDKRELPDTDTHWSGHMVVIVDGWLIDATVYQMIRPAWDDLPGMFALPLDLVGDPQCFGLDPLSGVKLVDRDSGREIIALWLAQTNERWRRNSPDLNRERRASVVKALVAKFGRWSS